MAGVAVIIDDIGTHTRAAPRLPRVTHLLNTAQVQVGVKAVNWIRRGTIHAPLKGDCFPILNMAHPTAQLKRARHYTLLPLCAIAVGQSVDDVHLRFK